MRVQVLDPGELDDVLACLRMRGSLNVRSYRMELARDWLAVLLMHDCALRISDAVRLKPDDIDQTSQLVRVWDGKGRTADQYDVLPLTRAIVSAHTEYAELRIDGATVLTTRTGSSVHRTYYNRLLKRIADQLGRPLHPHLLRHTAITDRACGLGDKPAWPLPEVQAFARHRSIQTTQRYTHVRPSWLERGRTWADQ